ncbi:hypothetical protein SAMN02745116_02363 [Pilibacter termitis]|uniref:MacB-like periplasmic core domain-containing protein n=1 Tax=Pilibacter termitis TaxID=263852 RepID=A0A1T4QXP4_9ENTE|nr:ABC transporter permease [Pilibacter termitis]SKA08513.1 hypothetical protein SAMN02745116_02363 [Pilibacter termitis]
MRNNAAKNIIFSLFLLAIAIVPLMLAIQHFERLKEKEVTWSFYSFAPTLTSEKAKDFLEKNKQKELKDLVIWKEIPQEQVSNKTLSRSENAEVILSIGKVALLFPEPILFQGKEKEQCVISTFLARKLFGMTEVVGEKVAYRGKEFKIGGVFASSEPLCILPATAFQEERLDTITLAKSEKLSAKTIGNKLSIALNFSGQQLPLGFLVNLAVIFLLLPMLILIVYLLRFTQKLEKDTIRFFLLLLVFLLLFFHILSQSLSFSLDALPPKWGDFDFYEKLWEELKIALDLFVKMPKRTIEVAFLKEFLFITLFSWVSLFAMIPFCSRIEKMEVKRIDIKRVRKNLAEYLRLAVRKMREIIQIVKEKVRFLE